MNNSKVLDLWRRHKKVGVQENKNNVSISYCLNVWYINTKDDYSH